MINFSLFILIMMSMYVSFTIVAQKYYVKVYENFSNPNKYKVQGLIILGSSAVLGVLTVPVLMITCGSINIDSFQVAIIMATSQIVIMLMTGFSAFITTYYYSKKALSHVQGDLLDAANRYYNPENIVYGIGRMTMAYGGVNIGILFMALYLSSDPKIHLNINGFPMIFKFLIAVIWLIILFIPGEVSIYILAYRFPVFLGKKILRDIKKSKMTRRNKN